MKKNKLILFVLILAGSIVPAVQCQTLAVAPPGDVLRPGHLGRQTGDLERIIHFYHDLLGLGLNGERNIARPFWTSPGLIEFANTPEYADFRAVIMPIPGTAASPDTHIEMTIEAIEFRNMERHQYILNMQDIGGSHLVLMLRDLDMAMERLQAEGVPVVTAGGTPLDLPGGPNTKKRGVIVRDPDGYPVELIELTPVPDTTASAESNVLGARVMLTVKDLVATLKLYKDLIGTGFNPQTSAQFIKDDAYNKLRNTPGAEFRLGAALIPGSPVMLEFIQYRNIEQRTINPILQDIGVAHVLFMAKDLDVIMPRLKAAGLRALAASGGPVFIAPKVRALFTTDPNNFFIEFMERTPDN